MKAKKSRKKKKAPATYRPSIVSFLDILGFKAIVSKESAAEIQKILSSVQTHAGSNDLEFMEDDDSESEANWTRCVLFSDSVVRARSYDAEYNEGGLFHEILDIVHAQGELSARGIFIRGGLTTGDIYCNENTIFGPAMVRAYELESSFANYPRVVIDPLALETFIEDKRLRAEHHDLDQDRRYISDLIRQGDDGLYFIDYLGAFRREMDYPEAFPDFLRELKATIVQRALDAKDSLSVLQKYLWLARYLNLVSSEHSDCAGDPKIVISHTDLPELLGQFQR